MIPSPHGTPHYLNGWHPLKHSFLVFLITISPKLPLKSGHWKVPLLACLVFDIFSKATSYYSPCNFFFGQSRSLFRVVRSPVSIEIGEATLIFSFFPLCFFFLTLVVRKGYLGCTYSEILVCHFRNWRNYHNGSKFFLHKFVNNRLRRRGG